jgi:hypothetical protein
MFGASDTIKRIMNRLRMRPGDVTSEGWWFWREWFIVMGKVDGEPVGACVCSRNKTRVGQQFGLSGTTICNDPDRWPSEVCAALAKWRLINGA